MTEPCSVHVKLAKEAIEVAFSGEKVSPLQVHELTLPAACFVSLHMTDGSLRGCIGTLEPRKSSLYEEIIANSLSAAFHDPRFEPLRQEELGHLYISVDVLHVPEPIASVEELDPLIYGVIVERGNRRGVLLPNLPSIATVDRQLAIAKSKAGIGAEEKVTLYRFMVDRYF